ncbi:hypothetical protein L6R53_10175 [Myxococcota bacterium]|nr:hypothetical protein [Myxococcota bacterium]
MVTVPAIQVLALLWACQARDVCEGGSMLDSEEGLVVTQAEHGAGWGQEDCFACHAEAVLHRTGCTPDVDLARLQEQVEAQGLASCARCHGENGGEEGSEAVGDTGEEASR